MVGTSESEMLPSEQPWDREDDAQWQPHHTLITSEDQVQIYQEVTTTSADTLTTSFLRRVNVVKDNRIRPKGFDPDRYARRFRGGDRHQPTALPDIAPEHGGGGPGRRGLHGRLQAAAGRHDPEGLLPSGVFHLMKIQTFLAGVSL